MNSGFGVNAMLGLVRSRGRLPGARGPKTHKSQLAIDLTRMELAVLQLLAEVMTPAQIARHMPPGTVATVPPLCS